MGDGKRGGSGALVQLALVALLMGGGVWWVSAPTTPDPPPPPPADVGGAQTGPDVDVVATNADVPPQGLDVRRIESSAQFDVIAFSGARGVVLGKSVKFLVDRRAPQNLAIYYVNANFSGPLTDPKATQMHYNFAVEALGIPQTSTEFNEQTYELKDKRFLAGTLQQYHMQGQANPTYAIQFYPQDTISEKLLLEAAQMVVGTFAIPDVELVLVPMGQQQTLETVRTRIVGLGIEVMELDAVLGSVDFLPMQVGEAWGYLRIFPKDMDALSATDIPVFDELPLDLTVVAGSITRTVQDTSSHINLKSKERGTPNMVLRSAALDHAKLAPFVDKPVHLVVEYDKFTITASSDEVVRKKLAERLNRPWRKLEIVADAPLVSFDDMCRLDSARCVGQAGQWGGKAANLGFLRHPEVLGRVEWTGSLSEQIGNDLAPPGVAVPVQTYVDFVANNPDLGAALGAFIAKEKAQQHSVKDRVTELARIQEMFMKAEFAPGVVARIQAAAVAALPVGTQNLKIRSSANAEDLSGFDGAGLYDSFRVRLSDEAAPCVRTVDPDDRTVRVRPRTTECVIKAVYASLWNKRAVEERSYARVDHETAGMGLAIVQRYAEQGNIAANFVVVTRVINSDGVYGYSMSGQRGNNVVTNPAPGTHSESVTAGFYPQEETTITVSRYAKPEPDTPALTKTVLNRKQMLSLFTIAQEVESAYCRANKTYYTEVGGCDYAKYDGDKETALDMEFKFFEDGRFLCKQVREFSGN